MTAPLRLFSFNVQHRNRESRQEMSRRMTAIGEWIRTHSPDAVALQEVTPPAFEILRKVLTPRACEYMPRLGAGRGGEGTPVFLLESRLTPLKQHSFWFSETPSAPSRSWKAVHPRVCSVMQCADPFTASTETALWLCNLHLDHRSPHARNESLLLLRRHLEQNVRSGDRIAVCGDFNMSAYHPAVREFLRGPPTLHDAAAPNPLHMARPTFTGWGFFKWFKARIDLFLHSETLSVSEYHLRNPEAGETILSDHRALDISLESAS
jgi:endonuclease/exonuclease/phosphatase family metal-dependent hydrolase